MSVGGASLAIIGSCQKVTAARPREAGVLLVVSEPILEVTWACAGQGREHVAHGVCNLEWSTTWHMCGTGHTDMKQEGTFLD